MRNPTAARSYLCLEPTDMRTSFDTLAVLVREFLNGDPQSGTWFVFRGKRGDRLKILYWDEDGYAIWQKRLEAGTFEFPKVIGEAAGVAITATDLSLILGGVARNAKRRPRYTRPAEPSPALKVWLDRAAVHARPKSPLGEAVTDARKQWAALTVYVTDGGLAIDNNAAERAVKPFAIGRKNVLFFGSDRGGRTLATLASFTVTCQQFGLNPWFLAEGNAHPPAHHAGRSDPNTPTRPGRELTRPVQSIGIADPVCRRTDTNNLRRRSRSTRHRGS